MKTRWNYKIEMYDHLHKTQGVVYEQAKKIPKQIGMPEKYLGQVGLTGTVSENHGLLRKRISDAMESGARKVISSATLDFEIRKIVKSVYGDEYDAVTASTCEALLHVAYDTLATPPIAGRGDNYRTRYLAPLERHAHHQAGYGRPFPPKYKDIFADRGVTAGEYGQLGKRLSNLDTVMVPLKGANYASHGLNYNPCQLLLDVDATGSAEAMRREAKKHEALLSAVAWCGYTLPGYGYREKDGDGVPLLQIEMARLAREYNVPSIVDNAAGLPFHCTDIRALGADLMLFSMDKSSGGPTCGLAIGREETISPLARALGTQGPRAGGLMSHGKAAYVGADPGKEALLGVIATLEVLLEHEADFRHATDVWYDITVDEFSRLDAGLLDGILISKDYNSGAVEVNYEHTWDGTKMGIPIFSIEDMYSGTSMLQTGMRVMGIIPCIAYDANIRMSPGLGTIDEDGQILEEPVRYMLRALVKYIELLCHHAGVLDDTAPRAEDRASVA
jgi:hypothetical protein